MSEKDDFLANVYGNAGNAVPPPTPQKSLVRRILAMLGGRIGLWLLGTVIMAALNNSGLLVKGFQAICALIGLMGSPEVRKKATDILITAETKAQEVAITPPPASIPPPVGPKAAPTVVAPETAPAPEQPKPEDQKLTLKEKLNNKFVDPAKKTIETNANKLSDKADTAKEELKETANKAADTIGARLQANGQPAPPAGGAPGLLPGGTTPALPGQARDAGQQASGVMHDAGNMASVAIEQTPYGPKARKAALNERESRLSPLRETYAIWWAQYGPNGFCPACRRQPMTVSRAGKGAARCPNPRCNFLTHADKVRGMGTPPMPPEPPPQFYAWKKARDEAEARAATGKAAEKAPKEAP